MNAYEKALEKKKKEMTKDYISSYKGKGERKSGRLIAKGSGKNKQQRSETDHTPYQ